MSKYLIFRGFFIDYDSVKIKIMFLDDYNTSKPTFTKGYLTSKAKHSGNKHPLTSDNRCFFVKYNINSYCYNKEKSVPMSELKQNIVDIHVKIQHYKFMSNGTQISGWNILLIKMTLV